MKLKSERYMGFTIHFTKNNGTVVASIGKIKGVRHPAFIVADTKQIAFCKMKKALRRLERVSKK